MYDKHEVCVQKKACLLPPEAISSSPSESELPSSSITFSSFGFSAAFTSTMAARASAGGYFLLSLRVFILFDCEVKE